MAPTVQTSSCDVEGGVKDKKEFRDYTKCKPAVVEFYRTMRTKQTYAYVCSMKKKYLTYDKPMMLWDALEKLDDLVDTSDPDISLPNVQHLLQSAEVLLSEH